VSIADAYRENVVEKPNFTGMVFNLLDGLGKGFAVVEPVWDTKTTPWTFSEFDYKDPHWFHFDRIGHRELRLRDETWEGKRLPGGVFLVHEPTIKSGLSIRGGLARVASIAYMAKAFTLKDWLAFMEVFGMPIRVGTYNPETIKEGERATLRNALANIGHDAAAMIPEGMNIDIVESMSRGSGGESLFGGLADYLDKQTSKAVLGQTMTTDDGSSLAQATVHQDIFQQFIALDARQVSNTINLGITTPWCQFNFGDNAPICKLEIDTTPPEDLKVFTEAALPWVVQGGLRVSASWVREKFGIPDPEETEGENPEILGGMSAEEKEAEEAAKEDEEAAKEDEEAAKDAPAPDDAEDRAQNRALPPIKLRDVALTEDLVTESSAQWNRVMQPHHKALIELARSANSYDEFAARLEGLAQEFDSDPFVDLLARTMAKARGIGDQEG